MVTRNITSSDRYVAARMSAQLGLEVQRLYGEQLVDLVKKLSSVPKAVVEMNLASRLPNASEQVVLGAARKALSGHNGSFGVSSYEGLLPDEERRELYSRGLIIRGIELLENGKGIHGLTEEVRKVNSGQAGKRAKELGRGIHGLTEEQNRINWKLAAEARGVTMWSSDERTEANILSKTPEYMRGSLIDCKRLADYLNNKYHDCKVVRTALTVSQALRMDRYKARKQDL